MPVKYYILLLIMCLTNSAYSAQPDAEKNQDPDLELLEFLGEWETDDGQWIDPMRLIDDNDDVLSGDQAQ